jgi:uncharacterized membrane protein
MNRRQLPTEPASSGGGGGVSRVRSYAVSAMVLLGLDLVWLGVLAPSLYQRTIGPLLRPDPNLIAAALFYVVYLIGVNELVVHPAPQLTRSIRVAARGGLLGFVAYATFDLTALAVLDGWSVLVTVVDIAWGTVLTAAAGGLGHAAAARTAPAPGTPPA